MSLIVGDEEISYRSLHQWSSRLARQLVGRGLQPGDRVGVIGPNSAEWCVAALAVLKAGAVIVPLNSRLVAAELRKLLDESGARLVLSAPEMSATMNDLAELGGDTEVLGFEEVRRAADGEPDEFVVDVDPDDSALVMFTSGTTGLSKGVIATNRTLLNIVFEASLTEEGLRPGARTLLVLPLAFTPGLVWGLMMHTVLGGVLVIEREFNPSRAVGLLEKHAIQTMFGVPLIFGRIAEAPEFADADLSALKTLHTGGAPVPVPLLEAWAAKGARLRQIYGMTEAGGTATATGLGDAFEQPDTCGTGSVFTEFKVVREDGTECAPGETGEIIIRGPGTTPGYWGDPESTAGALRDGWLHSGDLGVTDADGRLKFVDRIKDLIISGGINVSPVEIEQVIQELDFVEEVAVIRARDERFGETPAAIVKVRGEPDPQAIIAHCNKMLADYKVPRYVVFHDKPLPRLPSGKLAKKVLRDAYPDVPGTHPKVR